MLTVRNRDYNEGYSDPDYAPQTTHANPKRETLTPDTSRSRSLPPLNPKPETLNPKPLLPTPGDRRNHVLSTKNCAGSPWFLAVELGC